MSPLWLLFALSPYALADAPKPITVKVKGMVCAFCARGLKEVLAKQKEVDHFAMNIANGEVLIWPKTDAKSLRPDQIQYWVEKAGLEVQYKPVP